MVFSGKGTLPCSRGTPLTVRDPILCVPPGECLVTGQSHFKSFDNRYFTFSGICQYLLARDCWDHSFSVIIETVQVRGALGGDRSRCFLTVSPSFLQTPSPPSLC